jgi:hypothetical protein
MFTTENIVKTICHPHFPVLKSNSETPFQHRTFLIQDALELIRITRCGILNLKSSFLLGSRRVNCLDTKLKLIKALQHIKVRKPKGVVEGYFKNKIGTFEFHRRFGTNSKNHLLTSTVVKLD